jgi:hypothetical protein
MRQRMVIAVVSAVALGGCLGLLAAGGGAKTTGAAGAGNQALERLQDRVDQAQDADDVRTLTQATRKAAHAKLEFFLEGFEGIPLAGCVHAGQLIGDLERIDTLIAQAAGGSSRPKKALKDAAEMANYFGGNVITKCEGAMERQVEVMKAILTNVRELEDEGKRPSKKEQRKLKRLKNSFLEGATVQGCDPIDLLDIAEGVDIPMPIDADSGLPGARRPPQGVRRLINDAADAVKRLRVYWAEFPCDPPGTQTTSTGTETTTETQTTTATGTTTDTTTPPPRPVCDDGADNDSDGSIDFPADKGCMSAGDTTEATTEWVFTMPGDGQTITNYIDYKAFFGPFGMEIRAYRVLRPGGTVHESNTPNHGATPISGTMPCAGLSATGIRAGIGSQAPTGGGLPVQPDDDHHRVVVETTDPAGGVNCGTGNVTFELAADTR